MTDKHLSDKKFSELDLPPELLKGVEAAQFTYCTPIQAESLPHALAGTDVAGQAQTGTGKTAAFLLATFHRLLTRPAPPERRQDQPRALILAPTRELAIQIHRDAEVFGRFTDFKLGLVYGGTGYDSQRKMLEAGVDVLIGTPGRLIDYFKQKIFSLKAVEVFVLDEADRMFDLGFIKDIRYLLRRMPPAEARLSMLFSATLSYRVTELAYEHMNNPQLVKVEAEKLTAERVKEVVYYPSMEEKIPLLIGLLKHMDPSRSLIFVNTKGAAERVCAWLEGNGFSVGVLSGDVPQNKRERLLQQFKEGELSLLVATDVAARGLHIPEVSHVFNYDLPQDAEDYVHRIGRTARAGASGDAVSFACEEYAYSLAEIQDYVGHTIPSEGIRSELLAEPAPRAKIERYGRGPKGQRREGGGRGRPSGRGERGRRSGEQGDRGRRRPGGPKAQRPKEAPKEAHKERAKEAPKDKKGEKAKKPGSRRPGGGSETPAIG
jgi:ATP-dependent RNA helicase RhlB